MPCARNQSFIDTLQHVSDTLSHLDSISGFSHSLLRVAINDSIFYLSSIIRASTDRDVVSYSLPPQVLSSLVLSHVH